MADVLQRCRRLGFPVFIKTDKKIGDLDSVTLLWLFYYLLEIYEPIWSHSPTAFTKSNYKPLATSMRLLELAHKCPKSKELKKPFEYKRSITSSLGCILDKLEAKYGTNKLYSTRFQHPSIQGMQQIKQNKNNKNNQNKNNNKNNKKIYEKNKVGIPRATSKDVIPSQSYEAKKEETEENLPKHHREEKAMECIEENNDETPKNIYLNRNNINNDNNNEQDIIMREHCDINNENNMNYKICDLHAYNFKVPNFQNETVTFHVKMQENNENLTMTQRFEQLQQKQSERMKKINKMKEEYNKIAKDLNTFFSFRAKSFQNTSSTDYALFQLESVKQKFKSEQVKNEKSVELMEEDGIDNLLNTLSNELNNWHK